MFEAVLFDMDGVLVDSEPLHFATTNAILAEHGCALEPDVYATCLGMEEVAFFRLVTERLGLEADPEALARRRSTASLERLARDPLPPREGVLELLLGLQAEGLAVAVATSAMRSQAGIVLERLGLARTVPVVVTIEDVARGKPGPDLFLEAARRLDVAPGRCLVVEDAVHGLEAARAAGMAAVAYRPEGDEAGPFRHAGARAVLRSFVGLGPEGLLAAGAGRSPAAG